MDKEKEAAIKREVIIKCAVELMYGSIKLLSDAMQGMDDSLPETRALHNAHSCLCTAHSLTYFGWDLSKKE